MFKNISNTTLTRLAINSYNIWIICTSYIFWINWKIWNCPFIRIIFNSVMHSLRYSILMWTWESCKNKLTTPWMTVINLHLCKSFKYFCKMWHIRKIEFRINTLHIHIHRKCNNIYITCSLTITKKCSLNSVCSCKKS